MSYYCDAFDKTFNLESKSRHFKSNVHKEFDRCKHIKLTTKNPNIKRHR